jgi:hypothetical protein
MLIENIAYVFVCYLGCVAMIAIQDALCVWWFMNEISSWEEDKMNWKRRIDLLAKQFGFMIDNIQWSF